MGRKGFWGSHLLWEMGIAYSKLLTLQILQVGEHPEENCFQSKREQISIQPCSISQDNVFLLADGSYEKSMEEESLQLNRGVVRDLCILTLRLLPLAQPH